jgi:hypothetical protein
MINLKSISKNVLLEVANKLVLRFEDEIPVKKDIISSISKYCEEKQLSDEEINDLIDSSKREEAIYTKDTEVEREVEEDVKKKENSPREALETSKKVNTIRLSYEEKQWLKFLRDRKITAKGFLQLRPNFPQKEAIYKLQSLGY